MTTNIRPFFRAGVRAIAIGALLAISGAGCQDAPPRTDAVKTGTDGKGPVVQGPYYYGLIEEYRTIVAEDPHNLAAVVALANAYYDTGQWQVSIRYYEQALRINPHNADVITDMGTCYRNLGKTDMAAELYERALKIEPTHVNALYNLGVVYGHDKRSYGKAIVYWEQLLKLAPNHPRAESLRSSIARFKKLQKDAS